MEVSALKSVVEIPPTPQCSALRKTHYASDDVGKPDYRCRLRSQFKINGEYLCRSHAQKEALNLLLALKPDLGDVGE